MAGYYDRDRRPRSGIGAPQSWDSQTAAGTMNHPTTHIGNTAEYMASGYPFVDKITINTGASAYIPDEAGTNRTPATGDVIKIVFPYVTRWIMVRGTLTTANVAIGKLHMGFSEVGVKASNNFDVSFLSGTQPLEVKCSELHFKLTDASAVDTIHVMAGLTNIPAGDFVVTTPAQTNIGVESAASVIMVHDVS